MNRKKLLNQAIGLIEERRRIFTSGKDFEVTIVICEEFSGGAKKLARLFKKTDITGLETELNKIYPQYSFESEIQKKYAGYYFGYKKRGGFERVVLRIHCSPKK